MWADLLFAQRGERLSKVVLFQITAMTDNDVQRASKLSIGPANTWSKTRIDCKKKTSKNGNVGRCQTDTVGRQKKKRRP
jgi:hypothetical protein